MVCLSSVFVLGTALLSALKGPDAVYLHMADLSEKLVIAFRPDGVSLVFGCIIGVLWPVTTVYAFSYMEHEGRENMFFGFFLITFGVVAGIAYSANFFTLYLCLTDPLTITPKGVALSNSKMYYKVATSKTICQRFKTNK